MTTHTDDLHRLADMLKEGNVEGAAELSTRMARKSHALVNTLDLEEDIIEFRNGVAALCLIGRAIREDCAINEEHTSQALRFVEEAMSVTVSRLSKKVGFL